MARLLTEQELQDIRDSGSAYGLALAASTRRLLDHIEAQDEALKAARRQERHWRDNWDDMCGSLSHQLKEAQVETVALREDLAANAHILAQQCDLARDAENEAARLQRLITEHDARVMQPGGVPYEYPIQLAAEVAAMREQCLIYHGFLVDMKDEEGHDCDGIGAVWCGGCNITKRIKRLDAALSGTAGQALLDELARLRAVAEAEKTGIYQERDRLVVALSKFFPAHLCWHPKEDLAWEADWRHIVCIHLPTGQVTWHIHDSEVSLFEHLDWTENHWDGHTTSEKYARLAALSGTAGQALLQELRQLRAVAEAALPFLAIWDSAFRHDFAPEAEQVRATLVVAGYLKEEVE